MKSPTGVQINLKWDVIIQYLVLYLQKVAHTITFQKHNHTFYINKHHITPQLNGSCSYLLFAVITEHPLSHRFTLMCSCCWELFSFHSEIRFVPQQTGSEDETPPPSFITCSIVLYVNNIFLSESRVVITEREGIIIVLLFMFSLPSRYMSTGKCLI